jgi:4-amino-4-deoxy-L-arabinose transferase-like glycosyltransferase
MKRWKALLPGLAVLVVALAVRLPALTAGLPYLGYVDEGHVLHHVTYLLGHHTWEPDTYSYPTLPFYLIAGSALAYSPVYRATHDRPLLADLSPSPPEYYDILEPPELIVVGRLVVLAFSLGVVALTGLLVRRLAGPAAGLFAAWLAALVPALVARSAIVNINPIVAFFVLAALLFAARVGGGEHPRRDALLAGAMAGFAGATKYPAALVCFSVALAIVLAPATWTERLRRLLLAGGAAVATLLVSMPALTLRTGAVIEGLRTMNLIYGIQEIGSYWDQMVRRAEWDLPIDHPEVGLAFLILALAGLALGLWSRRWSGAVWGWLLFGLSTALLVTPYKFRAFRNLLALVPFGCALVALLYAWLRERTASRRRLWLDVAAAALPILLFAPALYSYDAFELALTDSRESAVRWLVRHTQASDRVLIAEELAILPHRIEAVPARAFVQKWGQASGRAIQRKDPYLVLGILTRHDGKLKIVYPIRDWIFANYKTVAQFGSTPTAGFEGEFRGNQQTIYILKRGPRPGLGEQAGEAEPRGSSRSRRGNGTGRTDG